MHFLPISILLAALSFSPMAMASDTAPAPEEQSNFDAAYDSFAGFFKELAVKFGALTDDSKQTLDELTTDIKNKLKDPDPAASVPVEGKTKKQWEEFNQTSPEIEERNRKLQEENNKMINNM